MRGICSTQKMHHKIAKKMFGSVGTGERPQEMNTFSFKKIR